MEELGLVTFVVAGFLLVSMGAAMLAAPVTVPLMLVAASRRPTRGFRLTALVLCALTVAEVVWATTYLTVEEAQPWIRLMPPLGALATVVPGGSRRHDAGATASWRWESPVGADADFNLLMHEGTPATGDLPLRPRQGAHARPHVGAV